MLSTATMQSNAVCLIETESQFISSSIRLAVDHDNAKRILSNHETTSRTTTYTPEREEEG